ncbi:[NiFe] hydrogenase assembly HybE family chaperone [Sinorhizobium kostiense]|uniref:[NiFe] hydrogenase assembly HybE family chaperone n=2 Tax=Sinorhizobium TaxID=28105 RepID=A0ABS4R1R3_9HYPH|nr:[NiFe]-hydrogenase assembly chaperone HybE [Sinorhizobium kostiense]MBP2236234.1 [NiFe] hydrogenase assembly HybE family chaperone [Sinorhizobium kostiense]
MNANPADSDLALAIGQRLEARYRHIHAAMADLSICNSVLSVAATGFRAFGGREFGIVTTPWSMNLVALDFPDAPQAAPAAVGTTARINLPAGEVDFIAGELDTIGRVDSCSLLSPVFEFATMEAAPETAEGAIRAFFDPSALEPPPAPAAPLNRRDLLYGKFRKHEEAMTE